MSGSWCHWRQAPSILRLENLPQFAWAIHGIVGFHAVTVCAGLNPQLSRFITRQPHHRFVVVQPVAHIRDLRQAKFALRPRDLVRTRAADPRVGYPRACRHFVRILLQQPRGVIA